MTRRQPAMARSPQITIARAAYLCRTWETEAEARGHAQMLEADGWLVAWRPPLVELAPGSGIWVIAVVHRSRTLVNVGEISYRTPSGERREPRSDPPPGIRGNLRPDLVGVVLRLDATTTGELRGGEEATLQVDGVYDAADTECVLVKGLWCGPGGVRPRAEVLVRAVGLPVYRGG